MSDDPDFFSIVSPQRTRILRGVTSRTALFRTLGTIIGDDAKALKPKVVMRSLLQREHEGSTALDDSGAAIPHCRQEACKDPIGCFFSLTEAIQFAEEEIDLVFGLIVPVFFTTEHLRILQVCAKVFLNPKSIEQLRSCTDDLDLYNCFQRLTSESKSL